MMLYEGCPTGTGVCVANTQSGTGSKTFSLSSGSCGAPITLTAGKTYFLILDSSPSPTCNPYSITMSSSATTATTAPCGFNYSVAPTTFNFENFTGTLLPTTDDVLFSSYVSFGFPFCFDGNSYSGGYVASNSSFVFDAVPCFPNILTSTYAAGGVSTGYTIPSAAPVNGTSIPRNAVLAPWHDIYPNYSGKPASTKIQYQVTGTSPNRKAVISWENVPMYGTSCESNNSLNHSSQIKIFEYDGSIEIHIKDKQVCSSHNGGYAVLGLHNYDGTIYIPPVNATAHNRPTLWTMTNTAYRYVTPCSNTSGCLTILPVGFINFYGEKIDEINTLFWNTATEENMSRFVIERSTDAINFTDIGEVNANNKASSYVYKDYTAVEGIINYYRIRAVENDGQVSTTNIVSIGAGKDDLLSTWPIYPNPTNNDINIRLNAKKQGVGNFVIYDMLGKQLLSKQQQIETGVNVYSVDVSGLAKGVYFFEIQNNLNEVIAKQKLVIKD